MYRKKLDHRDMKKLALKVVADCRGLAEEHIRNWQPFDKSCQTIEGAVYLRLSDDTQVAVERGSLEQQIHIAISEAQYRSEQEKLNYRITEFYIEPGITGTHDNRPEFIRLQHNISLKHHSFVIIKEIARLVRDLEIWKRFFRLCQTYDCEICIRGLPFNPNDPASILQLDQLAAFAEFESRTTSKRIRESNHSAMLTSGKFNTYCPLLGFDALKNERGDYTGIYEPNKTELKQVECIMTKFLQVDRYSILLAWCKKMNIQTKQGKDFNRASIRSLLTNPRYIGKWYRNKHNEGKRQSRLMAYERYTEVELQHGSVIDVGLWQMVQDKVKDLDKSRAHATKHCYPLSGLLVYPDGSNFIGSSAWGRTKRSTYYHNKSHKIRVRAEAFDAEAEKILRQVAENAPEFQKSVADYAANKESSTDLVTGKIAEIDVQIAAIATNRQNLDNRLTFLLQDGDMEMANSFREEYKRQFSALQKEERELESRKRQLRLLQKQIGEARDTIKSGWLEQVSQAINCIKQKDFVSLRSIYRRLFDKIIVHPLDNTKLQLEFIFNNMSTSPYQVVDRFCAAAGLVGLTGA